VGVQGALPPNWRFPARAAAWAVPELPAHSSYFVTLKRHADGSQFAK
jgi:hypothetical protein